MAKGKGLRPLIGVSGRRRSASALAGTPSTLGHLGGDWFYSAYAAAVSGAGGVPVHLPLDASPSDLTAHLDGIVLSGGADVHPDAYGAESETQDFPPEPERDAFEFALLNAAMDRSLAVLGVCRGMQIMNVALGGTLHQHVPGHARFDAAPETLAHSVEFTDNSLLAEIYGSNLEVNSLHHQTVDALGSGFVISGRANDGVVEGLEHATLPMIAVQWHPEMMASPEVDPAFRWLVQSAGRSERRSSRDC